MKVKQLSNGYIIIFNELEKYIITNNSIKIKYTYRNHNNDSIEIDTRNMIKTTPSE